MIVAHAMREKGDGMDDRTHATERVCVLQCFQYSRGNDRDDPTTPFHSPPSPYPTIVMFTRARRLFLKF